MADKTRAEREHEELVAARQAELDANSPSRVEQEDSADPNVAFRDVAQPQSAAELEAFNALEPSDAKPAPFSKQGRDYYADPDGKIMSVDAGFDTASDYPDWKPATAAQVAERELQKRKGSFFDKVDAGVEAAGRTLAEVPGGIEDMLSNVGIGPARRYQVDPEAGKNFKGRELAPGLYTDEALEKRDANPWSATAGALAADLGVNVLLPGEAGLGKSIRSAIVGGLTGAATDVAVTGEPFNTDHMLLYMGAGGALEAVSHVNWGEAMRSLGKKPLSAVDGAVNAAKGDAVKDALLEKDPARQAQKMADNAEAIYEKTQADLDGHLEVIDERMASAPDKMFTPAKLKKTVSANEAAQGDKFLELSVRLDQAAHVVSPGEAFERSVLPKYGPVQQVPEALAKASDALGGALGESGPRMFGALREARSILLEAGLDSPLAREALDAIETTLKDEGLWGKAAKDHAHFSGPVDTTPSAFKVDDLKTREALDSKLDAARRTAILTGDKALTAAVKGVEAALEEASKVTGSRLMGPVKTAAVKALKSKATSMIAEQFGKIAGVTIGGALGGIPGAIGGGIAGSIAGDVIGPYVSRGIDRLAGVASTHSGKLGALAVAGGAGLAALEADGDHDYAAAGLGVLAVPILLRGGNKVGLLDVMREIGQKFDGHPKRGSGWLDWETKAKVYKDVLGTDKGPIVQIMEGARLDAPAPKGINLAASDKEIEQALRENPYFEGNLKDARKSYQSEARATTRARNTAQAPGVKTARAVLGPVAEELESPFRGQWHRYTAIGRVVDYTANAETLGEVIKARLKDKAPLSFKEMAQHWFPRSPGMARRQWTGEGLPDDVRKLYEMGDEGRRSRFGDGPSDARRQYEAQVELAENDFHRETRKLHAETEGAALRKRVDSALEGLGEGDRARRVDAEDHTIRSVLREALGLKPQPKRELATHLHARSRYHERKSAFDAWANSALDEAKREALKWWQSHEYRAINANVREGPAAAGVEAQRIAGLYDALYPGLVKDVGAEASQIEARTQSNGPALLGAMNDAVASGHTVPGVVTRGISMTAEEVERLVNAKTVTAQGFMSTSIHDTTPAGFAERRAGEFKEIPVMLTVEQKTGVPIGQGEGEITLRPGTKFSVEWVQPADESDNFVRAYLREVEPSKLTPSEILAGIAGKIPTEAKVAAGLLAVDAVTHDDDDNKAGISKAGIGALAILFGSPRKLLGLTRTAAMLQHELGVLAPLVERHVAQHEDAIAKVAGWGKTDEHLISTKNSVEQLKDWVHVSMDEEVSLRGNYQALLDSGKGPDARRIYQYADTLVEKRLAEQAGAGQLGGARAAPRTEELIAEYATRKSPFDGHPIAQFLSPQDAVRRRANASQAMRDLAEKEGSEALVAVNQGLNNLSAHRWIRETMAGIDSGALTAQAAFDAAYAEAKGVAQQYQPGKPLSEAQLHYLDTSLSSTLTGYVAEAASNAALAAGVKLPALGLQVRSSMRTLVEDPNQSVLGLLEPPVEAEHIKIAREALMRRLQSHSGIGGHPATAITDDIIAACSQGQTFENAVEAVASTLDQHAELLPLSQEHQQRAAEAFNAWEDAASNRFGFSIKGAIESYAGDWDYKNINAYARGQMGTSTGAGPVASNTAANVLEVIESGGEPWQSDLNALIAQASDVGDDALIELATKALEHGHPENFADLAEHLKNGPMDGEGGLSLHTIADTEGKASRLQHALDLAVSDGYVAPGVTYRGALLSDEDLARIEQAAEVEAHAFMSTTADADYAARFISRKEQLRKNPQLNEVLFEVVQRTGVPMNTSESEVLLRSGTRFRVEPVEMPLGVDQMQNETAKKVRFRLVELDHDPKLPNALGVKSALPWVAGGVLAIGAGAALEGEAEAAGPTSSITPEEQMQMDATQEKLRYVAAQGQALLTTTARALVSPSQKDRVVPIRPGLSQSVGVATFAGAHDNLRSAYEEKKTTLRRIAQDPMSLVDEMAGSLADLSDADPKVHGQVVSKTYEVLKYLHGKLPGTIGASLTRPDGTPPSEIALRQFALYYSAATNPSTVLGDLANNRVRKEQVETLREIWPEQYQKLKLQVLTELAESRPTVAQRARLDLLFDFGESLERAFSPRIGQVMAASYQEQGATGGQEPPGRAAPRRRTNPSIGGAGALTGLQQGAAGLPA